MLKIVLKDAAALEQWHFDNAKAIIDAETSTNKLFSDYKKNLRRYLLAPASEHSDVEARFSHLHGNPEFKEFVSIMKTLYYRYSNKYGYDLVERIGLKTCPYCNRAYIFVATRSNEKGVRPEIDHFVPKSVVPALALNLYNLIPACPPCNHLKKTNRLKDNPYLKESSKVFRLANITDSSSLKLESENMDYKEVLLLDKLYAQHKDYVQEILDKAFAYNNHSYDGLLEDFQAMAKTRAELERLVWGTYIEESEQSNRPLSKLTADILEQLDIRL